MLSLWRLHVLTLDTSSLLWSLKDWNLHWPTHSGSGYTYGWGQTWFDTSANGLRRNLPNELNQVKLLEHMSSLKGICTKASTFLLGISKDSPLLARLNSHKSCVTRPGSSGNHRWQCAPPVDGRVIAKNGRRVSAIASCIMHLTLRKRRYVYKPHLYLPTMVTMSDKCVCLAHLSVSLYKCIYIYVWVKNSEGFISGRGLGICISS